LIPFIAALWPFKVPIQFLTLVSHNLIKVS
jgi:hypothetical protein